MPRLAVANETQMQAIYGESHTLWGAGLTQGNYSALWADIHRTPWARKYMRFLVWIDEADNLLSSLKLYRPLLRIEGRTDRVSIIGAVFTPRTRRLEGHAGDLVRAVVAQGKQRGDRLSLLFSDIGTLYYTKLGFRALPAEEQWGGLPRRVVEPAAGWSIREAATDEDLADIRRAHEDSIQVRSIAVVRDKGHWDFLGVRSSSFFRRLEARDVRQRTLVAQLNGRFSGYIIAVEGRGEWNVREVGAVGGCPDLMAAIVRLAAVRAVDDRLRRFYAWLPREVIERLGDWRIRSSRRKRAIPMILPLSGPVDFQALESPGPSYIPYQDQF